MKALLLRKAMCASCPFQKDSPYQYLAPAITASACGEGIRICHSTGSNNGINHRTGRPRAVCAGTREIQLQYIAGLGVISEPTEKAWQEACDKLKIKNGVTQQ